MISFGTKSCLSAVNTAPGTARLPTTPHMQVDLERDMGEQRMAVFKVVHELVVGNRSSAFTRAALLPHLHTLASFLGRRWAREPVSAGTCNRIERSSLAS